MNGGSDVLPGSLLFSQGGHNRQKLFGFSLSTGKKYYIKSVCLSKVEASVYKTIEFKDFPNVSLFFTNTYAVTRIRTWVIAATTQCTNHYTITAKEAHQWCNSGRLSLIL